MTMHLCSKVAMLLLALAIAPAAVAQHEHGAAHEGHAEMGETPTHDASAWSELRSVRDAIAQLVESGKLAEVHGQAARLGPLSQALSDGARSLPAEKRTRVEATLRQLPLR